MQGILSNEVVYQNESKVQTSVVPAHTVTVHNVLFVDFIPLDRGDTFSAIHRLCELTAVSETFISPDDRGGVLMIYIYGEGGGGGIIEGHEIDKNVTGHRQCMCAESTRLGLGLILVYNRIA